MNIGDSLGDSLSVRIPISPDFVQQLSRFDRLAGNWAAGPGVPAGRLARIEEAARIQATASSARLAGLRVTDRDVGALLLGEAVPVSEAVEIQGYAAALTADFPGGERLLTLEDLHGLHARMLGVEQPCGWRTNELHREGFDADGKATGLVFPTLPARLAKDKADELLTWLELELRSGEHHPVLVVGVFLIFFLAISPFERGNGRLARLLAGHLLRRAGYGFLPYASLERELEDRRDEYQHTLLRCQTRLWTGEADLETWLGFFLRVCDGHRERVEAKVALEREARDYPPLQRAILEAVREHGDVDAGLLLKATGANRNTLKDNLRRLVQSGVLEKTGQRRGTRYRMPTGEPHRRRAQDGPEL